MSNIIWVFSFDEPNTYNILKVAGSPRRGGYIHSADTKAKMSKTQKSIDRTGESNPLYYLFLYI